MKKASIISIGNELLNGRTLDTNVLYLGRELLLIGVELLRSFTVGDDVKLIADTINLALEQTDIVLITGGLGPTDDDVTRQALAEFLKVELELDNEQLQKIEAFFKTHSYPMPDRNKIQAYVPAGTSAINNNVGTAPGVRAEFNGKLVFLMPGVPSEMKNMFQAEVLPELKKFTDGQIVVVRRLHCFGAGESSIAEKLGEMMTRDRNPLINCTVKSGVITLHIIAKGYDRSNVEKMASDDEKYLHKILGDLIFGVGEQTQAEVVGNTLSRQKKTLAVAESCTGGLLAKLLTDVPGSSAYFKCGWVTYSNESKIRDIGLKSSLIEKHGAVSEEVARALCRGARQKAQADFGIAITGIAGPSGGSETKPVGLVYIGVDHNQGCSVKRYIFAGKDRGAIRFRAAQTALDMLRLAIGFD